MTICIVLVIHYSYRQIQTIHPLDGSKQYLIKYYDDERDLVTIDSDNTLRELSKSSSLYHSFSIAHVLFPLTLTHTLSHTYLCTHRDLIPPFSISSSCSHQGLEGVKDPRTSPTIHFTSSLPHLFSLIRFLYGYEPFQGTGA